MPEVRGAAAVRVSDTTPRQVAVCPGYPLEPTGWSATWKAMAVSRHEKVDGAAHNPQGWKVQYAAEDTPWPPAGHHCPCNGSLGPVEATLVAPVGAQASSLAGEPDTLQLLV